MRQGSHLKTSVYMAFRHILHTVGILAVVLLTVVAMYVVLPAVFIMPAPHFKIKLKCIHKFMEDIAPVPADHLHAHVIDRRHCRGDWHHAQSIHRHIDKKLDRVAERTCDQGEQKISGNTANCPRGIILFCLRDMENTVLAVRWS